MLEILAPLLYTLYLTTKCPSRIIRCSFLEPFARDRSYFAGVYRQKTTMASEIDFLLMFEWPSAAPPTPKCRATSQTPGGSWHARFQKVRRCTKECSHKQRLSFANSSLELRLTFGGPFQESSVVGGGQAFSTDFYQGVIIRKCARALFAATDRARSAGG